MTYIYVRFQENGNTFQLGWVAKKRPPRVCINILNNLLSSSTNPPLMPQIFELFFDAFYFSTRMISPTFEAKWGLEIDYASLMSS